MQPRRVGSIDRCKVRSSSDQSFGSTFMASSGTRSKKVTLPESAAKKAPAVLSDSSELPATDLPATGLPATGLLATKPTEKSAASIPQGRPLTEAPTEVPGPSTAAHGTANLDHLNQGKSAELAHGSLYSKLGRMKDCDLPLFEAAVWVAQEEFTSSSVEDVRAAIRQLAGEVRPHLSGPLAQRYAKLGDALFDHIGFRGNREDYYDPLNSYLPKVIERRLGIPLTLALVVIEVAKECGLRAVGVGFPGHFLVRHDGDEEILLDPFTGVLLSREELVKRVDDPAVDDDSIGQMLQQSSNMAALLRLVSNLKHAYMLRSDYPRALRSCEILLALDPLNAASYRDRGLVFEKLEMFKRAETDLSRYLQLSPSDKFAPVVEEHLSALRNKLSLFH
jgi:regulator of sirC expression with transglutaminase-like and TPR domain